jgi:hypothetical protein
MSLSQSHSAMLKRYLKEEIIENEMKERSYIWKNCTKEYDWAGGVLEVPVSQNGFNTIQMGSLAASNDIAEYVGAVGTLTAHKEMTMTALFKEADLARHTDKEKSYLQNIPGMIESLSRRGAEQIGISFLRGSAILSKATANGHATLGITVENPEFFEPMMKVAVDDDDSNETTGYVRTVDLNTGIIVIYDARTGGSVVDLSGYTTAQNAVVKIVGGSSESFLDLKTALLPGSITGGNNSLYGLTKASYMPLQAYRKDGSTFTANTILSDLLGAFYSCRKLGRGDQQEIWVNYGLFKNAAESLQVARQYTVTDKAAGYGWNSISLIGLEGSIKLVALREMPKDVAYFVDPKGYKFKGLPLKKKLYGEAGLEYYVERATTGISFITDMALRGDFVVNPSKFGVVYGLPDSVSA